MIEIVEGVGVGAGKSYYVCTRIAKVIANGGTVCLSDKFGIQWDRPYGPHPEKVAAHRKKYLGGYHPRVEGMKELIEDEYGVVPLPDQCITFSAADVERTQEVTPQGTEDCPVLIVVDEAQDGLGVGDITDQDERAAKARKKAFFKWLCQSRHDDNDLIFITQNANNIDIKIRRLATYLIRIRNMTQFAIGGMKTTWWKKFCVNVCDAGQSKTSKSHLRRDWLPHDGRIFSAYTSKSQKGAHRRAGVVSRKTLVRSQKPVSKAMKVLLVVLTVALVGVGFLCYRFATQGNPILVGQTAVPTRQGDGKAPPAAGAASQPPKKLWLSRTEVFRGGDGRSYLHTDAEQYYAGELASAGMVEGIRGHVAKLKTDTGETLYVIAKNGPPSKPSSPAGLQIGQTPAGPTPAPVATVTKLPEITPAQRALAGIGASDAELQANRDRLGGYPVRYEEKAPGAAVTRAARIANRN